ncbi:CU044_2847 family protein [Actinocrispum sp. NPDC049592]|uniref:CU044_2847 family protein n=1 Tax=Actinocrispum sp. NPDC049592 TaxID=3154835 RepID=UPI003440835A
MTLESGDKVLVEVDTIPGVDRASTRADKAIDVATHTLDKGLEQVAPVMNAVVNRLRDTPTPPDKVTLQFGLKVSGELGLIIGKSSAEANFTITAEWNAPK